MRREIILIDLNAIDAAIRYFCQGGCPSGHAKSLAKGDCPDCRSGMFADRGHNVVQVAYDRYQVEALMQAYWHEAGVWAKEFDQGTERLVADSMLHKLALRGELAHNGDPRLREHVLNACVKSQVDQDSQMRIVKKAPNRKVDLAVAASMAVNRVLSLNL